MASINANHMRVYIYKIGTILITIGLAWPFSAGAITYALNLDTGTVNPPATVVVPPSIVAPTVPAPSMPTPSTILSAPVEVSAPQVTSPIVLPMINTDSLSPPPATPPSQASVPPAAQSSVKATTQVIPSPATQSIAPAAAQTLSPTTVVAPSSQSAAQVITPVSSAPNTESSIQATTQALTPAITPIQEPIKSTVSLPTNYLSPGTSQATQTAAPSSAGSSNSLIPATIKGVVSAPANIGSAATVVTIKNSVGESISVKPDAAGAFSVTAPAGLHVLYFETIAPERRTAATVGSLFVQANQQADIGAFKLFLSTSTVTGKVLGNQGAPLAGARLEAVEIGGYGFASARADSAGVYKLTLSPGQWSVAAQDPNSGFDVSPPVLLKALPNQTKTVNLSVFAANSTIIGTVNDKAGAQINDLMGWAELTPLKGGGLFGAAIKNGQFFINAPAGDYFLTVRVPPNSSFAPTKPRLVNLPAGSNVNLDLRLVKNTAKILGAITDPAGVPLTQLGATVFASSREGGWQEALVDVKTGSYSLKVAPGIWQIGALLPADERGWVAGPASGQPVVLGEGEKAEQNLSLRRADGIITGLVNAPDFAQLGPVEITAFPLSSDANQLNLGVLNTQTDGAGKFILRVPAGGYRLLASVSRQKGISAGTREITVDSGATQSVNFDLKISTNTVYGVVYQGGKPAAGAFISAWSDAGGYQEAVSDQNGFYELKVEISSRWHLSATLQNGSEAYNSNEQSLQIIENKIKRDLLLENTIVLPAAAAVRGDAALALFVTAPSGPAISVPARALSPAGAVTLTASPDARPASSRELKIIGIPYDIAARANDGEPLTKLSAPAIISFVYRDSELQAQKVSPDSLSIAFWNEAIAGWESLKSCATDAAAKTVSCLTNHLTRFVIVSPADIIPPAAPGALSARIESGRVALAWSNPQRDFAYVNIYRSPAAAEPGMVVLSAITESRVVDATAEPGVTYYYRARAVDPAGNESASTPAARVILPRAMPGKITTSPINNKLSGNLSIGSRGAEVRLLQTVLTRAGFFPGDLITGYFGAVTRRAVVIWQEKYADQVLAPLGLKSGTGVVGLYSRRLLNEKLSAN